MSGKDIKWSFVIQIFYLMMKIVTFKLCEAQSILFPLARQSPTMITRPSIWWEPPDVNSKFFLFSIRKPSILFRNTSWFHEVDGVLEHSEIRDYTSYGLNVNFSKKLVKEWGSNKCKNLKDEYSDNKNIFIRLILYVLWIKEKLMGIRSIVTNYGHSRNLIYTSDLQVDILK